MSADSFNLGTNAGSLSINSACFATAQEPCRLWPGLADRIGVEIAAPRYPNEMDAELVNDARRMTTQDATPKPFVDLVETEREADAPRAVGYSVQASHAERIVRQGAGHK